MKVTRKELARVAVLPLVQLLLPGAQTAYIMINLENILSQEIPYPSPATSTQRLHVLQNLR